MNIGDFEILETLGSGGSGIVYRARNNVDRIVALKQLNRQVEEGDKVFDRFKREAMTMASVRSDHVVTLFSYQVIGKRPVLEMEYVEQGSLEALMKAGPLDVATTLHILSHILAGLKALHGVGIVHRDVKPANVLIGLDDTGRERFKLSDFGLSVAETEIKTTFEAATIRYVAPECTAHPPRFDFRSDLYSVGMIAYEALLGAQGFQDAFPDVTPVAAFGDKWLRWLQDPAREAKPLHQLLPDTPPPVAMLVARLMAKDPERRFASADAVLEALVPLVESLPPPAALPRPQPAAHVRIDRQASTSPPPPHGGARRSAAIAAASVPVLPAAKKGSLLSKVGIGAGSVAAVVGAIALGAYLRKPAPTPSPKPKEAVVASHTATRLVTRVIAEDGRQLPGAALRVLPGDVAGRAGGDGTYAFDRLAPGHYEVTTSLAGYQVAVTGVDLPAPGKPGALMETTITLKAATAPVPPPPDSGLSPLEITRVPGENELARVARERPAAAPQAPDRRDPPQPAPQRVAQPLPQPVPPRVPQPQNNPPRPPAGGTITQAVAAASTELSRAFVARVNDLLRQRGVNIRGPVRLSLEMTLRDAPFQGVTGKTADWVATVRSPDLTRSFEGHALGFAELTLRNTVVERAAAEVATALAAGAP